MNRDEILAAARQCVSVDRAATYGDAEQVYGAVGWLWNAYSQEPCQEDALSVLVKMALMKIARAKANPQHADSWIDAIGYLALAGELSTQVDKV